MRVRSFFSVKNGENNGKICLQDPSDVLVLSQRCAGRFRSVCREDACAEPVKLNLRGFESRRTSKDASPVDRFLSFGTPKEICTRKTDFRVRYKQGFVVIPPLVRQCESAPCLRADTAFSRSEPKRQLLRAVTEALKRSAAAFA